MSQKKLLLTFVICLVTATNIYADEPTRRKASLKEVTVFFQGAELIHEASVSLSKGVNDVLITDLSPSIDINSLRIKTTHGAIVASFEYSLDYINKKQKSANEKTLKDSIKIYKERIKNFEISIDTNGELLELLKANRAIGGSEKGLSVTELMKMVDYYGTKSNEINREQGKLEDKKEKAEERLGELENQLEQESVKNITPIGVLKLNLTSPLTATSDITITYYTRSAGWTPYYDINVPSSDAPIQIAAKAKVQQTTGLDWNKIRLALATTTPSNSKVAPLFSAWFLDFYSSMNNLNLKNMGQGVAVQNRMSYDQAPTSKLSTIRGAAPTLEEVLKGASPIYIINGITASEAEYQSLSADMIKEYEFLKDASATAIYGSRAANGVVLITTKRIESFVQEEENQLSSSYNIDLPYTITGNGKIQNIDLKKHEVVAEFKHYCVPKMDAETFVIAEISDWQKLGLLSGKANVTFDGTYVGETVINGSSIAKKLSLTLGTDKRVSVKREKLQDFSSKKFLGKDIKQEFTYKLTVKNNQNKPIKMVLKDQYPISNQKEIEVELISKETTPATHNNEEVGVLSWEFDLGAGEQREFRLKYSVKYPKDKPINL